MVSVCHGAWRIKEENGITFRHYKRFKATTATASNHNKLVYPNVLDQKFTAKRPNESWDNHITYIWTSEGWVYLAGVKNLYIKELVSYFINKHMTVDFICEALNTAVKNKVVSQGVIINSDRGTTNLSSSIILKA